MNLRIIVDIIDNMKEILYIFLGWFLGLFTKTIATRIESHYKRNSYKIAIFSELKNLSVRLCTTYYHIQQHLGKLDKSSLRWVKTMLEKYGGNEVYLKNIVDGINRLLQYPDNQLNSAIISYNATETKYLTLKTFLLPFSVLIIDNISIFDSKFQRDILEVRTQISLLNEEIENAAFQSRLTFESSITVNNIDIIKANVKTTYIEIQNRCKFIVDKIDKILQI